MQYGDQPERYTWRTLLQAVAIGIVGQVVTIGLLRRLMSPQFTTAVASGVFCSAVWFWSPQTRPRLYWPGYVLMCAVGTGVWLLLWRLLS